MPLNTYNIMIYKQTEKLLGSRIIAKFLRLRTEDAWTGNAPDG